MPQFNPTQLAEWTHGHWTVVPTRAMNGFGIDSRRIGGGDVFVALRTEQRDGHAFLAAALAKGATAAIVSEEQSDCALPQLVVADTLVAFQAIARAYRREFSGQVIGITGSAGKTSTKDILTLLLGERAYATQGNLNNHLGVPLTLTQLDGTAHDFGVIEAGISGPGEMDVLANMIEPDQVIVTLVDHAHTADLGDLAGVAREKFRLSAAVGEEGTSYLPIGVASMAAFQDLPGSHVTISRVEVLSGTAPEDAVRYLVIASGDSTVLSVAFGMKAPEAYSMARVSEGMAQNAVLAIAVARSNGIAPELIRTRLATWRPSSMRGEVREEAGRMVYLDCYNANPASMRDALGVFVALAEGKGPCLYVLGGMEELGAVSAQSHRELGEALNLTVDDRVLVVGTDAEQVKVGALNSGAAEAQVQILANAADAESIVAGWMGAIFIKGSRRYRLEQLIQAQSLTAV